MTANRSSGFADRDLSDPGLSHLSSRVRVPGFTDTLRIFNHYIHRKLVALAVAQFLVLFASVYLAVVLRFMGLSTAAISSDALLPLKAAYFALVVLLCIGATGLYQRQRSGRLSIFVRMVTGFLAAVLGLALSFYLMPSLFLGRGILAIALLVSFCLLFALQVFFSVLVNRLVPASRVVFYGAGTYAADLIAQLRERDDYSSFTIVACVPANGETPSVDGDIQLADGAAIIDYARRQCIDEIVIAQDDRNAALPEDALIQSRISGINVTDGSSFWERQTGCVQTDSLSPSWIIFADGFRSGLVKSAVKRALDLVSVLVLLTLAWPVMLIAAVAIKLEEGWRAPVFFWQQRTGLGGKTYAMCKFRSMRTPIHGGAGPQWTEVNDVRITRVGGVLRKYRIDELPQLFNVLRGDMSMVGPRPEQPRIVGELVETVPYYWLRECVRPGLTGWAQLRFRYGASVDDAKSKLQFDLYYVKNRSLFLDLLILLGTFEVIVAKSGSR